MKKYIAKRLLSVLPILFIVSLVVFALVHLAPGSPAAAMLGSGASMEDIAALGEQMAAWPGSLDRATKRALSAVLSRGMQVQPRPLG